MQSSKRLKIIVDNRENKLIELIKRKESEIDLEVEQLDIADIVISKNVGIERKEGFDFISSIMDNRLFEQLERLKNTYPDSVLILEGLNDEVFGSTGMKIESIYGALAYVSYKLKISVIPTRNLKDTLIVIKRMAYREQVEDKVHILARSTPKNMSMRDRRAFILEGLLDCGPKKAKLLIKVFNTPQNVFEAIRLTSIIFTKNNKPKGIEGPIKDIGLKGFGWKFIQKNKKLLYDIEEVDAKDSSKTKNLCSIANYI